MMRVLVLAIAFGAAGCSAPPPLVPPVAEVDCGTDRHDNTPTQETAGALCLEAQSEEGTPARMRLVQITVEGDPVTRVITFRDGVFEVDLDSRDNFGFFGRARYSCTALNRAQLPRAEALVLESCNDRHYEGTTIAAFPRGQ